MFFKSYSYMYKCRRKIPSSVLSMQEIEGLLVWNNTSSLFIFPVAKCRKATFTLKKKYHYFLILCVGQPLIKNTGTGHAWLFIVGDRREFRRECKKMCGSVISKYFTIYGISGKINIAALFSKHMKTYIIHTEIIKKISLIYIMWKMTILQQKTALIS